jgi:uncharacterized LabA/DUF88 family protein
MPIVTGRSVTPLYRRVMIFEDGGYLRKIFHDLFCNDRINFLELASYLTGHTSSSHIRGILQRVYYYDAIIDPSDDQEEYNKQNQYLENIREYNFHEVKTGRLIKTKESYKQKGVDVLLAIDMITKAYHDQYDIAILVAGDDDFIDVVKAVKDGAGKLVYGAFYPKTASKRLINCFDMRIQLNEEILKTFCEH